jgi:hypothetical protein
MIVNVLCSHRLIPGVLTQPPGDNSSKKLQQKESKIVQIKHKNNKSFVFVKALPCLFNAFWHNPLALAEVIK